MDKLSKDLRVKEDKQTGGIQGLFGMLSQVELKQKRISTRLAEVVSAPAVVITWTILKFKIILLKFTRSRVDRFLGNSCFLGLARN